MPRRTDSDIMHFKPEDGSGKVLRNDGNEPPHHMAEESRKNEDRQ
jgi:hypothetical protein